MGRGDEEMNVRRDGAIAVKDGMILEVLQGEGALDKYQAGEIRDGKGLLFMPGLVDSHMHTGQQLLKGKILDELPMIWTRIMLPFESGLTEEMMELSAQLAALEMIKGGTSAFVDAGSYHMETAAAVYLESGLRGVLSHSTMDAGNLPDSIRQTAKEAISSTDRLYDSYHGKGNLKVFYSLRSLISCSPDLILAAAERAKEKKTGLQSHMNEYPNEINFYLEKFGKRPLEYLESIHVLSPDFMAAHCLLLSAHEIELMREYGVKTAHCPFSNCGKGIPETPALLERGIPVGLGTDGTAHGGLSLWNEMKIFRSVMNAGKGVGTANPVIMPAKTILNMATRGGAAVIGEAKTLGVIKEGYRADLISINIDQPHLMPTNNMTNTLMECVNAGDVNDMMVAGKWLMKDRTVLTLDEEGIMARAREFFERK